MDLESEINYKFHLYFLVCLVHFMDMVYIATIAFYRSQTTFKTDPATLGKRQKQIDFGKNTDGYRHYVSQVKK